MNNELLKILICILCQDNLKYDKENQELLCFKCNLAYPIKDGIPIILSEEARILNND